MKGTNIQLVFNSKDFDGNTTWRSKLTSNKIVVNYPELNGLSIQSGDYLILDANNMLSFPGYSELVNPIVEVQSIAVTANTTKVAVQVVFSLHSNDELGFEEKRMLVSIHDAAEQKLSTKPVHTLIDDVDMTTQKTTTAPHSARPPQDAALASMHNVSSLAGDNIDYTFVEISNQQDNIIMHAIKPSSSVQSNDIIVLKSQTYLVGGILWDVRNRDYVSVFLLSDGKVSLTEDLQIKSTAEQGDAVIFNKHKRMRLRYHRFKTSIMKKYRSVFNLAHSARSFVLKKFRIKTFLGNAKTRALQNAAVSAPGFTARVVSEVIPVPYAATIWGLGVDKASSHVINYFDTKNYNSMKASPSALQHMIAESEFKFEDFSNRLNYSYWEVMERYQHVLQQSADMHRMSDENFTKAGGLAENVATWDALREETLEYANFLRNISDNMHTDLHNMDKHMSHIARSFEKRVLQSKAKSVGLRSPEVVSASVH